MVGVLLLVVLCLIVFYNWEFGFMILMGVFGVCVVDMLGLLKYKYNEMFVCSVIGFLVVFVIGFVILNIFVLWFMIVLFMFVLLLIVVYGNCWL